MTRFLFWNLHREGGTVDPKRATALCLSLTRLVRQRRIDVLVFAEYGLDDGEVSRALDGAGYGHFHRPTSRLERTVVWTNLPSGSVVDRYNGGQRPLLGIQEVIPTTGSPIWLMTTHLRDRSRVTTEAGRGDAVIGIANAIRLFETRNGSARTLLLGDLNMNPFEYGVVGTNGLHAMMTRSLARSVPRLKARRDRPCFYNPMWSLLGDLPSGPPGSYFWPNPEEATNHFWHMYDQVLVRPELIDAFLGVEVLDGDGVETFVSGTGRPSKARFSDHLPLFFHCDFTR